jgi:hypothetical protein
LCNADKLHITIGDKSTAFAGVREVPAVWWKVMFMFFAGYAGKERIESWAEEENRKWQPWCFGHFLVVALHSTPLHSSAFEFHPVIPVCILHLGSSDDRRRPNMCAKITAAAN